MITGGRMEAWITHSMPEDVVKNWWEALSRSVAVNESRTKVQELQEEKG